jgi:hypothetical protein
MVRRAPKSILTFDIPRIMMGGTECQLSLCRIERRRNQPAVGSSRELLAATRPPSSQPGSRQPIAWARA